MRRLLALAATLLLAGCAQDAPPSGGPGGPFQLTDQNGRAVTEALLEDRWSVVFFGFTYCPDACPTMLQRLDAAEEELGPRGKDLQVVFISVDPERDTPAAIKAYLEEDAFPEDTIGLTGTPEQIAAVTQAYKVYAKKSGEGEDYVVDHTTAAYLMNPDGQFVRVLAAGMTPTEMAVQIRDAMRG
jgi:protein SCO1/2